MQNDANCKQYTWNIALFPKERAPVVIQFCLISRIGLWEKLACYALLIKAHYFPFSVGFTLYVIWLRDSLVRRRSTECQLGEYNVEYNYLADSLGFSLQV